MFIWDNDNHIKKVQSQKFFAFKIQILRIKKKRVNSAVALWVPAEDSFSPNSLSTPIRIIPVDSNATKNTS
jgi:hypothetical protein